MKLKKPVKQQLTTFVAILMIAGTMFGLVNTGVRDICRNGVWEPTGVLEHEYRCSSDGTEQICAELSSTSKTCYVGTLQEITCQNYQMCTFSTNLNEPRDCVDRLNEGDIKNVCETFDKENGNCVGTQGELFRVYCLE